MTPAARRALRQFLDARDVALRSRAMGDALAKAALVVADEARRYWRESEELLDACERYAAQYAHVVDTERANERWPAGLETAVREAIERRDEAGP
jgi:hypothetical protein